MGLVPLTLEPSHLLTFKIGMSRMIANFLFETQILHRSPSRQPLKERGCLRPQIKPSNNILYRRLRRSRIIFFYSVKYKIVSIACVNLPQLLLQRLNLNKSFM